jgi:DNA-binding transcriptional ArsR family regulator
MRNAQHRLIPLEALEHAAECLRTLAHPVRLRMVQMLLQGKHTVGELAIACRVPAHVASEHLGKMKDRGLLQARRDGRRR